MARERLSMRKIREILRLQQEAGLSEREIARSSGVGRTTVANYLKRAAAAGIGWPVPAELDDEQLYARLFPEIPTVSTTARPLPDMAKVHQEVRRPHVTLQLLWEEYRGAYPEGYGYTQFCEHYKRWKAPLGVTLRQHHVAGEKTFLDWAGDALTVVDASTGEAQSAYLFVAVLGASDYLFAEALANQKLDSWIEAHIHAVEYFGGCTRLWVPDNAKTGVTKACYYEPEIHRTYQELADHYGVAILPTRTYAARDKAKVENAVLIAYRRILARLRDQTFFSLGDLNQAIRQALTQINQCPFQKLPGSRQTLFETLDRPYLRPLPEHRYQLGQWSVAKVNIDYHIQVDWHFYSVPYPLAQQQVEVRRSARTVEIYRQGQRVATHPRSWQRARYTTDPAHRPKSHQKHLEWTPGRLIDWAGEIGPECAQVVTQILASRPHPEQGYRACLGLMRLARSVGHQRMEAACRRAAALDVGTYKSIRSILHNKLDQQPLPTQIAQTTEAAPDHDNIRGHDYYQALPQTTEETSC